MKITSVSEVRAGLVTVSIEIDVVDAPRLLSALEPDASEAQIERLLACATAVAKARQTEAEAQAAILQAQVAKDFADGQAQAASDAQSAAVKALADAGKVLAEATDPIADGRLPPVTRVE